MSLKGLEKLGAVAGFIPFVSTLTGLIKAYIYYGKAHRDKAGSQNTENLAVKIDYFSRQKLNINKQKNECYDKLWKASLIEAIPIVNLIAAVYSSIVLSKLSGLRDLSPDLHKSQKMLSDELPPRHTEVNATDEQLFNLKKRKLASCDKVIARGKNLNSIKSNLEKCELLDDVKNLLKITKNPLQINQLLEIEKNLNSELLSIFPDYLDKVLANSEAELTMHQMAIEPLLNPIQNNVQDVPIDDYIAEFTTETTNRLKTLNFYQIKPGEEKVLQKLISINQGSGFKVQTLPLKEHLEQQLDFYKDLRASLEETFEYQDSLLQPTKLGLNAHIPLNYSREADDYFLKHEKEWSEVFKNIPNECPVNIVNPNGEGLAVIKDEKAFIKLRDKYKSIKSEIHDQMIKCLPKEYPVQMPNFLSNSGEPSIQIQNDDEFKKIVATYATYIEKRNKMMKSLSLIITEKTKTLSELKNI